MTIMRRMNLAHSPKHQARLTELYDDSMLAVTLAVQDTAKPEPGNWRFGETEDFSARAAALGSEIIGLRRYESELRKTLAGVETELKKAIAQEHFEVTTGEPSGADFQKKKVKAFTNDFERKAELQLRLEDDPEAQRARSELEAVADAIAYIEIARDEAERMFALGLSRANRASKL